MSKKGTVNEKLAMLCTDVSWLKKQFENHLAHHFWFLMILASAVVGEAIGFLILAAKHVF